jgi:hypothetical protein
MVVLVIVTVVTITIWVPEANSCSTRKKFHIFFYKNRHFVTVPTIHHLSLS